MPRFVDGVVNYIGPMEARPRYHAQDHSRDNLVLDPRTVRIEDLRETNDTPALDREGFALVAHESAIADFRDTDAVKRIYMKEVETLIARLSGADRVVVSGAGILRFGERSPDSGRHFNSRPARFIHVDISDPTARAFAARARPEAGPARRFAHYNIWRAVSEPPQDVPLAVCDARSVARDDLVAADAVFDTADAPQWSFEGLVVRHDPRHRWCYFSNMTRGEALVFKTNDSDPSAPHCVPHSAFDDPECPPGAVPRASIEMRAIALWD
jgi:hypothetical protein